MLENKQYKYVSVLSKEKRDGRSEQKCTIATLFHAECIKHRAADFLDGAPGLQHSSPGAKKVNLQTL